MQRFMVAVALILLSAGATRAQDTPLSDILIDGQGWKPVDPLAAPKLTLTKEVKVRGQYTVRADDLKSAGLAEPSGLVLWPDGGTLVAGDAGGKHLWAFRIDRDGKPVDGDRYYALRVRAGEKASGVRGLTIDNKGRVYACTPLGVQVFDPTGRLSGVMVRPGDGEIAAAAFGGEKGDTLFVLCGGQIFARQIRARGVGKP